MDGQRSEKGQEGKEDFDWYYQICLSSSFSCLNDGGDTCEDSLVSHFPLTSLHFSYMHVKLRGSVIYPRQQSPKVNKR